MRHGDKINNLGRTKSHRKALLKNLSSALIMNKGISTTLAKAKALRTHVEPILTKAKNIDTQQLLTHRQRLVFSYLQNEDATKELFTVIAPKIAGRNGGYCRIIKLGRRKTDSAEMAYIELVDFNTASADAASAAAPAGSKAADKPKRTRRSGTKSAETHQAETQNKSALEKDQKKEKPPIAEKNKEQEAPKQASLSLDVPPPAKSEEEGDKDK